MAEIFPANPTPSQAHRPSRRFTIGPLTAVLMAISIGIAIWSHLGENGEVVERFLITQYAQPDGKLQLEEVSAGEVWRLITPIFLHFGIVHLLFNMLWLKDLGTAIEKVSGTGSLLAMAIVSGLVGNLAEFAFQGPLFGGMSGVVYCLFGYVWMKAKFDPASGFYLDGQTVWWMIGWFVLCLTGALGPVANFGHGGGLAVGVAWGFVSAKRARN